MIIPEVLVCSIKRDAVHAWAHHVQGTASLASRLK
jgi:hypothetical protein